MIPGQLVTTGDLKKCMNKNTDDGDDDDREYEGSWPIEIILEAPSYFGIWEKEFKERRSRIFRGLDGNL